MIPRASRPSTALGEGRRSREPCRDPRRAHSRSRAAGAGGRSARRRRTGPCGPARGRGRAGAGAARAARRRSRRLPCADRSAAPISRRRGRERAGRSCKAPTLNATTAGRPRMRATSGKSRVQNEQTTSASELPGDRDLAHVPQQPVKEPSCPCLTCMRGASARWPRSRARRGGSSPEAPCPAPSRPLRRRAAGRAGCGRGRRPSRLQQRQRRAIASGGAISAEGPGRVID